MRRFLEGRLTLWAAIVILALSIWAVPRVRPTSANVPHTPSFTISLGGVTVAPYGIAATPGRLLVTVCVGGGIQVLSVGVDSDGVATATVFAPITGDCIEPDIAIAPATPGLPGIHSFPSQNAAGFFSNYAYVTQATATGLKIWQVTHLGMVSLFATLPDCVGPTDHGNISFSRVVPDPTKPSFGPHGTGIVSCTSGLVWKLLPTSPGGSTGTATLVGNVRAMIEGPDVAPLTFTVGPGDAFFGSESDSQVYRLSPRGQVRRVVTWPAANQVDFVAKPKCDYLTSLATYFAIVSPEPPSISAPARVWKFPQSAFTGPPNLGGIAALVTRGFGTSGDPNGIGLLTSDRGGSIRPFHAFEEGFRGAAFAYCDPTLIGIDVEPQSNPTTVINWGSNGLVTVIIQGSATFDVNSIILTSITFGWTGDEQSLDHCTEGKKDYDGDGDLDVECKFRIQRLGVPLAEQLSGVKLILKLLYNAPSGDPPAEGSD